MIVQIKNLIAFLENCPPEAEIGVALRKGMRPHGFIQSELRIEPVIDMDTNKTRFVIDVDIEDSLKP